MRRSRFPMKRKPSIPVRDLAARHIVTDARTAGPKQRGSEASRLLLGRPLRSRWGRTGGSCSSGKAELITTAAETVCLLVAGRQGVLAKRCAWAPKPSRVVG